MLKFLESYIPSRLEQITIGVYEKLCIKTPSDIDIRAIANYFDLQLVKLDVKSKFMKSVIVIDSRLSFEEQREDFFHEFTHATRHAGNQMVTSVLFQEIQEFEANQMPYYWLVPTYMLADFDLSSPLPYLVPQLAEAFKVTEKFMENRLNILKSRIEMLMGERQFVSALNSLSQDYNMIRTIGSTEYYCKDGQVLYYVQRYE